MLQPNPVEESPVEYVLRGRLRAGSMEGLYVVAAVMAAVGDRTGVVAGEGSPAVAADTPADAAVGGVATTDAAAAPAPNEVGGLTG